MIWLAPWTTPLTVKYPPPVVASQNWYLVIVSLSASATLNREDALRTVPAGALRFEIVTTGA